MNPQKLFNLAKTFPIVNKRKLFKNLLLYPTALLTALSSTFLIQEKTNSQLNTEIFYNVKVCNEYKKKIFVARAKQRAYLVAGDRNYGNPYGLQRLNRPNHFHQNSYNFPRIFNIVILYINKHYIVFQFQKFPDMTCGNYTINKRNIFTILLIIYFRPNHFCNTLS